MLNNLYTFSVPVFLRGHAVLSELLRKGEAHAAGYKITPSALLTARLFPDMFPLTGQVQAACDTAKRATARLVGVEPPRFEDNEATFEELYARIQRTSEFVMRGTHQFHKPPHAASTRRPSFFNCVNSCSRWLTRSARSS